MRWFENNAYASTEDAPAWGQFSFGRTGVFSMGAVRLTAGPQLPGWQRLRAALAAGQLLFEALLAADGPEAAYLASWAERIQPPPGEDIPPDLLNNLPSFDDARLDEVNLPPVVAPLETKRLPLMPEQPARHQCPLHPLDLYAEWAQRRIRRRMETWLQATRLDLQCIQEHGDECERRRPRPLAIGASGMHDWARHIVWDFTRERHPKCGVPLDFHAPIESHLNLQYLERRLRNYPDQQLVGYLVEAHVEA